MGFCKNFANSTRFVSYPDQTYVVIKPTIAKDAKTEGDENIQIKTEDEFEYFVYGKSKN